VDNYNGHVKRYKKIQKLKQKYWWGIYDFKYGVSQPRPRLISWNPSYFQSWRTITQLFHERFHGENLNRKTSFSQLHDLLPLPFVIIRRACGLSPVSCKQKHIMGLLLQTLAIVVQLVVVYSRGKIGGSKYPFNRWKLILGGLDFLRYFSINSPWKINGIGI